MLVAAVVGTMGTLGYLVASPKLGEKFTEFYLEGFGGRAIDYPKELKVGQQASIVAGIINHEQELMGYRIEITINDKSVNKVGPLELEHEAKWQDAVAFTPNKAGDS